MDSGGYGGHRESSSWWARSRIVLIAWKFYAGEAIGDFLFPLGLAGRVAAVVCFGVVFVLRVLQHLVGDGVEGIEGHSAVDKRVGLSDEFLRQEVVMLLVVEYASGFRNGGGGKVGTEVGFAFCGIGSASSGRQYPGRTSDGGRRRHFDMSTRVFGIAEILLALSEKCGAAVERRFVGELVLGKNPAFFRIEDRLEAHGRGGGFWINEVYACAAWDVDGFGVGKGHGGPAGSDIWPPVELRPAGHGHGIEFGRIRFFGGEALVKAAEGLGVALAGQIGVGACFVETDDGGGTLQDGRFLEIELVVVESGDGTAAEGGALLDDVCEFVGKEVAAGGGVGGVVVVGEDEVVADGVGTGVDGACRAGGLGAGVDADVGEVMAEAGFEVGASFGVERGAGGVEDGMDDGRGGGSGSCGDRRGGGAVDDWRDRGCEGGRVRGGGTGDGVGDVVGFLFVVVVGVADGEGGFLEFCGGAVFAFAGGEDGGFSAGASALEDEVAVRA